MKIEKDRRNKNSARSPGRKAATEGNVSCVTSNNKNKVIRENISINNNVTKLQVLHFNSRGFADNTRLYEFEKELGKLKWDIIGISETRREGEKLIKRKNGNYFYYFGETKGYRGTGFYIRSNIMKKVLVVKGISERISVLKLNIQNKVNMTIIQIYAPTMEATDEEKENFYKKLEKTIQEEKEYYNVIMGDWNSKIGQGEEIRGIIGPYGLGEQNQNGEKMIEFAGSQNLKIANNFFKKHKKLKWTWMSPDSKTKNEIDHLLINDMRIVENVVCLPSFKFPSDHRITRATLKFEKRMRYKNFKRNLSQKKEGLSYQKI